MYTNLGKKIQVIGKVMGWLLLIAGIIMCLVQWIDGYYSQRWLGWIYLVGGVLGFISSWFICAYGQLVDDVNNIRAILETPKVDPHAADAEMLKKGGWECSCGRVNASYVATCACGRNKTDN